METNLGYIRRTIKPALGMKEMRKVRGPLLDHLYARLQQCGSLACGRLWRVHAGAVAGRGGLLAVHACASSVWGELGRRPRAAR